MSKRSKGDRHEREAKKLLEEKNYQVHKKVNNQYDSGDIFGLFDLIAVKPERKPVFIQVKTNGTAGELTETLHKARKIMNLEYADLGYFIKYDYEGWRVLISKNGNDWDEILDERDSRKSIGEIVVENENF